MAPAVPKKIDKYDVVDVIGRGGMGVVYKAIDRSLGRFVAIKMVTNADEEHGDLLKRFYREAQFTAKLRHQNIVTVYDLGDFAGTPYLVMEYLSGKSLDGMLAGQAMKLEQKIHCIGQVCNGLQYAHSCQPSIIHRDIKPANIVVAEDGTAKIIDFGIARLAKSRDTRTGHIMGSYQYMSPEQINGSELDGRSDIFSTGVVLYQALTSTLPFEGSTIAETLQKIVGSSPRPLRQFLREYPARLDDIMARALAKNREERYQSANEFAFDLNAVEEELKRQLFGSHLDRAEAFLHDGEYERAKQELAHVLEVDRHHARANDLVQKVQRAITRQQRKTRARHLRSRAEEALKMNRLNEAISYLEQAVRLDPSNPELQVFRERVLSMQARAERVNEILSRAERAFAADDLEEANRAVGEALQFDPSSARAKSFKAIVETKLAGRERQHPSQGQATPQANQPGTERGRRDATQIPTLGLEGTGGGGFSSGQNKSGGTDPIWSDTAARLRSPQRGSNLRNEVWSPEDEGEHLSGSVAGGTESTPEAASDGVSRGSLGSEGPAVLPKRDPSEIEGQEPGPSSLVRSAGERGAPEERETVEPVQRRVAAEWPEDMLRDVEKKLAALIGPLAKVIVKKAASRTTDSDKFFKLVAAGIAAQRDRQAFLAAMRVHEAGPQNATKQETAQDVDRGPRTSQGSVLTPAAVEHAARLLAQYVGPLSGVLTKKAAQRADNLRTLYLLLAEHVRTESERDQFLQEAGIHNL